MHYRQLHFFLCLCLLAFLVYAQAFWIGPLALGSRWFQIDIVTVAVFYMGAEHPMVGSIIKAAFTAALLQALSLAPSGFFLMYFLLIIVLINTVSRRLVLQSRITKVLLFILTLFIKPILLGLALLTLDKLPTLSQFGNFFWRGILTTLAASVPVAMALMAFDRALLGRPYPLPQRRNP